MVLMMKAKVRDDGILGVVLSNLLAQARAELKQVLEKESLEISIKDTENSWSEPQY